MNAAIRALLAALNQPPVRKLPGSRASVFAEVDRPALRPLPAQPYVHADWKRARVGLDYHVEVDGHYYSVPYGLARQGVDLRITAGTIAVLHCGQRVASHVQSPGSRGHTTVAEHMPSHHRHQAEWNPERLLRWAATIGPQITAAVQHMLTQRRHPEQGFRAAMGTLRLAREVGPERLEAACTRALALNAGLERQRTAAPRRRAWRPVLPRINNLEF